MNTKLTLRIEEELVRKAKRQAALRGKSVSQMFGEFVETLHEPPKDDGSLPPVTRKLRVFLKGHEVSEQDYREHLRRKHA